MPPSGVAQSHDLSIFLASTYNAHLLDTPNTPTVIMEGVLAYLSVSK